MNASDREQLRLSLLRFLDENKTRFGIAQSLLFQQAKNEGRSSLTITDVEFELEYLAEKQLVFEPVKLLSPELRSWKITAGGRDFLAQR